MNEETDKRASAIWLISRDPHRTRKSVDRYCSHCIFSLIFVSQWVKCYKFKQKTSSKHSQTILVNYHRILILIFICMLKCLQLHLTVIGWSWVKEGSECRTIVLIFPNKFSQEEETPETFGNSNIEWCSKAIPVVQLGRSLDGSEGWDLCEIDVCLWGSESCVGVTWYSKQDTAALGQTCHI